MKKLLTIIGILILNVYSVKSQTWSLHQHRDDLEFSDIKFLNANEGFVFADSSVSGAFIAGAILKTTDGGQSWSAYTLTNSNYRITKGFFLNSSEGYIVGRNGGGNNGLFLKSIDGGVNWTNPSNFSERLFNVFFLNSTTGGVMGKNGLLSKTTDGGLSWVPLNITNEDINAMKFFNSTQGVMVCGGGEIYITSDAGLTWNAATSNANDDLISVTTNNTNAWICGIGGTLLYSSDAGQSWAVQTAAVNVDFNDISFPDGITGFTAGIAGFINQTQNAGTIWQNQNSNCTDEIIGLAVPDVNHGWFCTPNGDIFSFTTSTGISETVEEVASVNIFPNPAYDNINAEINLTKSNIVSVKIYDIQGMLLLNHHFNSGSSNHTIPIKNLVAGMYMAEFLFDNKKCYSKFIKTDF